MKTITKFVSNDGTEHVTREAAEKQDSLHARVAAVMAPLGDIPEAVKRGKGWVQHNPETVLVAREGILALCVEEGFAKCFPVFNHRPAREVHPCSAVGRILSDNGGPLNNAWGRFGCIDDTGREHQQCYFAYTSGPDAAHYEVENRS